MEDLHKKTLAGPKFEINIPEKSLGELMLDRLRNTDKDRIALINVNSDSSITYGEILRQSILLAKYLTRCDLKKGDVVSIVGENSVNYCVPLLASFYVGLTANPINSAYVKGELKRILGISSPKIIFCSEESLENVTKIWEDIPSVKNIIVFGESFPFTDVKSSSKCFDKIDENIDDFVPAEVNPSEDVAYILCSSGTTGFPKGAMINHQGVRYTTMLMSHPEYGTWNSETITVVFAPLFHMMGLSQLLVNLYYGSLAIMMSKFHPTLFLESIQKYRVTKLILVPTLLIFLCTSPLVDKYDLSSLKHIIWGATSMGKEFEIVAKKRLKLESLCQIYGATETGTVLIYQTNTDKVGVTGCLTPNVEAIVCDPETDVPLGSNQLGELRFRSPTMMKGYINDQEATAAAFDGYGFWKSGDAGHYDEKGRFYIVDRFKDLIKYKGFQVPPAEIETILLEHPAVKEACVVGRPDERAGEIPVAFVVIEEAKDVSEAELIDLVAKNLSIQKRLYGGVRFLKEMPKNSTGKILRKKLKEAVRAGAA